MHTECHLKVPAGNFHHFHAQIEFNWKRSLAIFSGHTHTCDSLTEILECVTKWSSWRSVRVQLLFNTYVIRCRQTTHHVSITSFTEWSETSTSYPTEQFMDIEFWSFSLKDRMCHKNLHVQIELQHIQIHENRLRIYLLETKRFSRFVARNLWPKVRRSRLCAWHPAYC